MKLIYFPIAVCLLLLNIIPVRTYLPAQSSQVSILAEQGQQSPACHHHYKVYLPLVYQAEQGGV